MNPLLEQYLQEVRENLKFVEQNIEELGSGDDELINSIFRAVHTIKGGSGIVEFDAVRNVTHSAEDLLDMLRSKQLQYKESMLDVLYDAFDEVLNLIDAAEETGDVVEADEQKIDEIVHALNEQMGKSQEVIKWELPFKLHQDIPEVVNRDLDFGKLEYSIVSECEEINQDNIQEQRLYAIHFDVSEDCMVFGNDPIYALSLMNEKLISIHSCFSNDVAKEILAGFKESDDDLILRTDIIGIVYSTFE
jgi:two-component system chemotaxis sensor kinase CheA